MVPYSELETFFTGLIETAQSRGVRCAITSGMACVHFGVAATTMDCDVLCTVEKSDEFRAIISTTVLRGVLPNYRGNISPPLDSRWMRGGWTSHFVWKSTLDETCLVVFGIAPRASSAWEQQLSGIYAQPNVVAEMKRTNRPRDWPFATALGGQMLEANNPNGWLHLYDLEVMRRCAVETPPNESLAELRPVLNLFPFTDEMAVKRMLLAEQQFWSELDAIRIRIMKSHLRSYVSAVRQATTRKRLTLDESHAIRVECASAHLPFRPLRDYGFERMIEEAKETVSAIIGPDVLGRLPAAEDNFHGL